MSRLSKLGDCKEEAQNRTKIEDLEDKVSMLQTKLGHCPILGTDNDMFAADSIQDRVKTLPRRLRLLEEGDSHQEAELPKVRFKFSFPRLQISVLSEVLLRIVAEISMIKMYCSSRFFSDQCLCIYCRRKLF